MSTQTQTITRSRTTQQALDACDRFHTAAIEGLDTDGADLDVTALDLKAEETLKVVAHALVLEADADERSLLRTFAGAVRDTRADLAAGVAA